MIYTIKTELENVGFSFEEFTKKTGIRVNVLHAKKETLTEQGHYYDIASTLLKDQGVRQKIIKQYVPIMNNMINNPMGVKNQHDRSLGADGELLAIKWNKVSY